MSRPAKFVSAILFLMISLLPVMPSKRFIEAKAP
jgi:hypothetical protein